VRPLHWVTLENQVGPYLSRMASNAERCTMKHAAPVRRHLDDLQAALVVSENGAEAYSTHDGHGNVRGAEAVFGRPRIRRSTSTERPAWCSVILKETRSGWVLGHRLGDRNGRVD
jgi:hypothetical protein